MANKKVSREKQRNKNIKSLETSTDNIKTTVSMGVKIFWIVFGVLLCVLLVASGIKLFNYVSENIGGLFN